MLHVHSVCIASMMSTQRSLGAHLDAMRKPSLTLFPHTTNV